MPEVQSSLAAGAGTRKTRTWEVLSLPFKTQIGHELHDSTGRVCAWNGIGVARSMPLRTEMETVSMSLSGPGVFQPAGVAPPSVA